MQKNVDMCYCPLGIYPPIYQHVNMEPMIEWMPYSQFTKLNGGGFGDIYIERLMYDVNLIYKILDRERPKLQDTSEC
jgi:hypothetical protein